jgi:transcriptional regulator with XRE-family HTH domain
MSNDLSRKIKELRLERNMTLEEVGKIVGVGKSTVRKWETGMIVNMGRDKIALLAKALGVTPAYLMGWKEETNTQTSPNVPGLTDGEKMLLDLFRQIPENKQDVVLEMIRLALKTQS